MCSGEVPQANKQQQSFNICCLWWECQSQVVAVIVYSIHKTICAIEN